jgi:toxin secretion/phage lysis holin
MEEIFEIASQFHFRNELWVFLIPLACMAVDVLSGITKAWVHKDFKSAVMRAGLGKKAGEAGILLLGELFSYGMSLPAMVMNMASLYIIFMEIMSIFENLDLLGVPIPRFVKDFINNVDDQLQNHGLDENKEE